MKTNKILKIDGTILDKKQLENHLQKIASNHNLMNKPSKETYPVPQLMENYETIKIVYNLLNEHVKLGMTTHPAGEWLLDNFYIIEETVKQIQKELTLKKYMNFLGIANGRYKGFARIYVLAAEIVAYTDNKIEKEDLEDYLASYQEKKTLSMEEIWNIGLFLQIAIIENIREICEKIYSSQIQKMKAENIVQKLIEIPQNNQENHIYHLKNIKKDMLNDVKYPFIEYMSYILKRYGKKGYRYLKILDEIVEMTGTTVQEVIKKEHFDIAVKKVSIGNSIISIKNIQRINFLEIFEKINGVEEILKQDPAEVYPKMDNDTKDCYRNIIKEISKKTKISEIYIAKKILQLAEDNKDNGKKAHIGYYIIDKGIEKVYQELQCKVPKHLEEKTKQKLYIATNVILAIILSLVFSSILNLYIQNVGAYIFSILILLIPSSEIVTQIIQYILSKIVKPKPIPKIDFSKGIDEKNACMVVIPTILKNKEKVKELMHKLEVYYIANESKNLYFTLLGDCSESSIQEEKIDNEVIETGMKLAESLNEKYSKENDFPIFHFIYRKREWNEKENCYLGWERKRGMLTQFNEYLLGNEENVFRINTIELYKDCIPKIQYVITLDADTELILNSAFELVGAMAHILNKPVIDEEKNVIVEGHGMIQPRIGINLDISYKTIFTQIFAGAGGIDSYTNAISDLYQDNFGEGIFTGKGIYDLNVFSKVLKNAIPENTVLSHDLLEGCYLRCGLATDIMLMDGYPTKYNSFMNRLSRWIRGDWQIISWLKGKINSKIGNIQNPLNCLSKYKIFDNLRRSLIEIMVIISFILFVVLGKVYQFEIYPFIIISILAVVMPYILEIFNTMLEKKEGEHKQKRFSPRISGYKGIGLRILISIGVLPYKAYVSCIAIIKTLYRKWISHKKLLEWMTSEEAEKQAKNDVMSYIKQMWFNIAWGILTIGVALTNKGFGDFMIQSILGILWFFTPFMMWYISKEKKEEEAIEKLDKTEIEYVLEIGEKTWQFFKQYITKENNYLIPDNYQEDRKQKIVERTSSTNIGLSVLAIVSSYDLQYENLSDTIDLLHKVIISVDSLQKWNGHLYNWYDTKTKEPLRPRYISTVDSGNFVGYLYVTKTFLEEIQEILQKDDNLHVRQKIQYKKNGIGYKTSLEEKVREEKNGLTKNKRKTYIKNEEEMVRVQNQINEMLEIVERIIRQTNFTYLYNQEHQIFSIGYNIEENKLTDSYYDLLATEARQASLVAIAKKDIPSKHWNHLSRTLTVLGKYKGLISWSGTAFEYLMPNMNIPKYKGSLLDESCKFMMMSQMKYAEEMHLPFGVSEAAFNLKDLQSNYQYKAFGIPWLGLKRGLADEMVVSSYGSILAITDIPKEVVKNLKVLEQYGMYNKYGFYESLDFTPERVRKGKQAEVVKTYMAHHQGLILLSINNLINQLILQKRFTKNPEIQAVTILLQETMPEKAIITKEDKEKVEKLKYKDYEDYIVRSYTKIDEKLITGNVISNENYMVAMNQKGEGVSKYKNMYINHFKRTDDYTQGMIFNIKSIKNKQIISSSYSQNIKNENQYQIRFMPDKNEQEIISGNIKATIKTTVASNEPVELRRIILENLGNEEEFVELTGYFEPILTPKEQYYAHPAFNNLFLVYGYNEKNEALLVKRKKREVGEKEIYLATTLHASREDRIGDLEYEIEEEKFIGRGNLKIPKMVKDSLPFSKKIGLVTEPIVAMKRTIKIRKQQKVVIDFILSVEEEKEQALQNLEKYTSFENVKNELELSKARVEAETRYLNMKGKDIEMYQKMLSYIVFDDSIKSVEKEKINHTKNYKQSDLWKYGISGDLPIVLVKMKNANDVQGLKEVLKAYEYFRTKNVETEIVIMDEEKYSYENYVREEIDSTILNQHMGYLKNIKGGIFILNEEEMDKKDITFLEFISVITIDCAKGNLENNLKEIEETYLENYKEISEEENIKPFIEENTEDVDILKNKENLKYYNEYGAFSEDGKEYWICVNKEKRLPTVWSHIMANEKFGTIVTENMGGYSWYKNSRLNRLTSWNNNPSLDIPSEIIYVKDMDTKESWSLGLNPMPDERNYNVIYGFGYCQYIHNHLGIEQQLEIFVPREDSCKIGILKLSNKTPNRKHLKLYYYIKPVIGEDELKTAGNISINFDRNSNTLTACNLYAGEIDNTKLYMSSSEKIKSYTGDKKFFLGKNGLSNPDGIKKLRLNNSNAIGRDACIVLEIEVDIESFSNKEISFVLGAEETIIDCKNIAYKYSKLQNCKQELESVKNYWKDLLGKLQVYTPLESTNILLNGWCIYQTLESRLLGRSGYYQSGGAFGFRDQLQDTIALKYISPEILKHQIIKHSKHQFEEGDVEHWWHEETNRGIRTRFSDDLLWLPYLVLQYIHFTGDNSILEIETPYLKGPILEEGVDERYDQYPQSEKQESIYLHCIRAIEKSFSFGENGLPKIGSGDWNDGFSTVGNKGRGESVWLGFFLYNILDEFIPICEMIESKEKQSNEQEEESRIEKYKKIKIQLKKALNTNGWDGRWYKRAFMDDGNVLGSMENDECRIDSIAQSWSIISKAGDNDKKYISMESLENHLVDKENGVIKLLDPPFEKGHLEPGYIKAYLPGVRENGGQYTHSSCWAIIAEALLGFGDKSLEFYRMINPIEHARTKDASSKYKVEPYAIAADIYGAGNLAGRGGWTWYTGSSSWYYTAGIEYILGLKIEKEYLIIKPCIPKDWKEYLMRYKWKDSIYNIKVINTNQKNTGVEKVLLNGEEVDNKIKLDGSNKVYNIEVYM